GSLGGAPEGNTTQGSLRRFDFVIAIGFKVLTDCAAAGEWDHTVEPDATVGFAFDPIAGDTQRAHLAPDCSPVVWVSHGRSGRGGWRLDLGFGARRGWA